MAAGGAHHARHRRFEDYQTVDISLPVQPMFVSMTGQPPQQLSVRIDPTRMPEALAFLEESWQRLIPERPFRYAFVDAHIEDSYRQQTRAGQLASLAAFLTLFLAALGTFGLASFAIERRRREMGVRKVLGASIANIITLLSAETVRIALAANLLAWPLAHYAAQHWLRDFAYRTDIGWGAFIAGGVAAVGIALLAVLSQSIKVARSNPVDSLRLE